MLIPADDYRKEQQDYFSHTAAWTDIHPSQVVGTTACFKSYNLHTVTLEELKAPLKVGSGGMRAVWGCVVVGVAAWKRRWWRLVWREAARRGGGLVE